MTDLLENPKNDKLNLSVARRYKVDEIEKVIDQCNGLTAVICAKLDCTKTQWCSYLRNKPELKKQCEEAREHIIDLAEKRLMELMSSESDEISLKAVQYILSRIGGSRGWTDKLGNAQQINISKDGEISIQSIFGITSEQDS